MATSYKLVDENEYAYTAYDRSADMVQLSFGNISLDLTHHEFIMLKKNVEETLEGNKDCKNPYTRDIIISTSVTNMVFVFCFYEIMYIYEVISNTMGMLRF